MSKYCNEHIPCRPQWNPFKTDTIGEMTCVLFRCPYFRGFSLNAQTDQTKWYNKMGYNLYDTICARITSEVKLLPMISGQYYTNETQT